MMTPLVLFQLLVAGPAEAQALLETMAAQVAAGNTAAAYQTAVAAVEADPENVDALWAAGFMAYKLDLHTEAATYLNTIIRLDPYDDDARLMLARVQLTRGQRDAAMQNLDAVLDANPAYSTALALKEQLEAPEGEEEEPWQHFARAGLGVGYDSNVALTADGLPEVSRVASALGNFELVVGATAPHVAVPLTVLATLSAQTSFNNRHDAEPFVPSSAGLALSGRLPVKGMQAFVDVRYNEIFTDLFQSHYARQLSPSLSVSPPASFGHEVRLLLGGDFSELDSGKSEGNGVLKASLRDRFELGRVSLLVEAGGRRRMSEDAAGMTPGRFSEARGIVYGESPIIEHLAAFVLGSGEARKFDAGLKESTYLGQAGLRYTFDPFEIHAEYGYSRNLSGRTRSYDRHQAGLGLRFWYF